MAIQHRRGVFNQFDPTRMLPGEWAVVMSGDTGTIDGMAVYMCFAAGVVKRMATYDDLYHQISEIESDIAGDLTTIVEAAAQEAHDAAADAGNYGLRIGQLEEWVFEQMHSTGDIEDLESCCASVKSDLQTLAFAIASLSGNWQYIAEMLLAPTAGAFSVSGSVASISSTVSDELLVLT